MRSSVQEKPTYDQLEAEIIQLRFENSNLKKVLFGQKRERFVPDVENNQLTFLNIPVGDASEKLEKISKKLSSLSFEERIRLYNLKPDRADVIVPGARIYLSAMAWAGCKKIHVPMQGLADGMVRVMHSRNS